MYTDKKKHNKLERWTDITQQRSLLPLLYLRRSIGVRVRRPECLLDGLGKVVAVAVATEAVAAVAETVAVVAEAVTIAAAKAIAAVAEAVAITGAVAVASAGSKVVATTRKPLVRKLEKN